MNDKLYLRNVKLSGYKSIEEVSIEFQNGLNIIIGKNAAGKTNFLHFLNKVLLLDFQDFSNFYSFLSLNNGKSVEIETNKAIELEDLFKTSSFNFKIESTLKISNKEVRDKKDQKTSLNDKLVDKRVFYDSTLLCHGLPSSYSVIDQPVSWKFEKKNFSNDLNLIIRDIKKPYFLRCFALNLAILIYDIETLTEDNIKICLNNTFSRFSKLSETLANYSPIEEFRVSDNYNIFIDEGKNLFTINNLFFEFKVDGQWLPFSSLSDGTKRLFYIISEIFDEHPESEFRPTSSGYFCKKEEVSRIILVEEPELGIHPHQFHKLLEFLKIQSETKQIIITTHSPQALDTLSEKELNKIILAFSTSKDGTKLRKMSEDELLKAKEYIKETFLSDYWLYSDLEK